MYLKKDLLLNTFPTLMIDILMIQIENIARVSCICIGFQFRKYKQQLIAAKNNCSVIMYGARDPGTPYCDPAQSVILKSPNIWNMNSLM